MPAISLKHRFIFIHIPKTAGTTLSHHWKSEGIISAREWTNWYLNNDHITADELKKAIEQQNVFGNLGWDDFYKFTIVRNPFDLFISFWLYKRISPGQQYHIEAMNMNFNQFTNYLLDNPQSSGRKVFLDGQRHWIEDQNGKNLLDRIIRLDDLESEYPALCDHLGIQYKNPMSLNSTGGPFYDHDKYFGTELRNRVEKVFNYELEKYGFEYRGKNTRKVFSEQYDNNILLYCSSLYRNSCGIANYTRLLAEAKSLPAVFALPEQQTAVPAAIHIQHEYGIMLLNELEKITRYCLVHGVDRYITLHTVRKSSFSAKEDIQRRARAFARLVYRGALYLGKAMLFFKDRRKYLRKWSERYHSFRQTWNVLAIQQHVLKYYTTIVHSESAKQELISQGGNPDKIIVQHHPIMRFPVSDTLHSERDGKLHVGIFGFMTHHKHIDVLIKACALYGSNIRLHIYSSTERLKTISKAQDTIVALARSYEWINLYTETLPLEQVVYNLSKNSVNVYLTRPFEIASSGAIRQYLAAKRPIIAYRSPMIEDVLDYVTVIDELSPEAVVNALRDNTIQNSTVTDAFLDANSWERSHAFYANYRQEKR